MIVECHNNTCYSIVASLLIFLYSFLPIFFSCRERYFPFLTLLLYSFVFRVVHSAKRSQRCKAHTSQHNGPAEEQHFDSPQLTSSSYLVGFVPCCEFVRIWFFILCCCSGCRCANKMGIIDVSFYRWVSVLCARVVYVRHQMHVSLCDNRQFKPKTICYYLFIYELWS